MMKAALITGASRGIGAATARLLSRQGYGIGVNYCRSEEQAFSLVRELEKEGGAAIAVQGDVSDPDQAQEMVAQTLARFGAIDVLVCNAGISHSGLLSDLTPEEWRHIFAVNVDGMFYTIQASLPQFIHRKEGRIITVSSMWGQIGASCEAAYSASKAAVIGLTKALAQELGPSNITVNCVAPGVIDTDMNRCYSTEDLAVLAEQTPLNRLGRAEEVAQAIGFLASEGASFITGQVLAPNGGFVC